MTAMPADRDNVIDLAAHRFTGTAGAAQCELPQGMVGTPRCTKLAEHVVNVHGCILDQPEKAWVRVHVCYDHVVVAHKSFTQSTQRSPRGIAECAECGKPFVGFRDMFRRVTS